MARLVVRQVWDSDSTVLYCVEAVSAQDDATKELVVDVSVQLWMSILLKMCSNFYSIRTFRLWNKILSQGGTHQEEFASVNNGNV